MDKDNLYLNMLAETLTERSASDSTDEEKQKFFHFKSFIQIMTTLREIIEKQDEISSQIEDLTETQKTIKSEVDKLKGIGTQIDLIKIESEKIEDIDNKVKRINESFTIINEAKRAWKKIWIWVLAFIAAMGFILGAVAWLNQMGFFEIVWKAKK